MRWCCRSYTSIETRSRSWHLKAFSLQTCAAVDTSLSCTNILSWPHPGFHGLAAKVCCERLKKHDPRGEFRPDPTLPRCIWPCPNNEQSWGIFLIQRSYVPFLVDFLLIIHYFPFLADTVGTQQGRETARQRDSRLTGRQIYRLPNLLYTSVWPSIYPFCILTPQPWMIMSLTVFTGWSHLQYVLFWIRSVSLSPAWLRWHWACRRGGPQTVLSKLSFLFFWQPSMCSSVQLCRLSLQKHRKCFHSNQERLQLPNKSHLLFLLPLLFAFMKASIVQQRCEKPLPRTMVHVSGVGFQPPSTCEEWSWSPALEIGADLDLFVLFKHLTWRNGRFDEMFATRAQGTSQ